MSLQRERERRRSAEQEHDELEQVERALKAELSRVQSDVDELEYRALIDEMDDGDVLEACADAGVAAAAGCSVPRARALLLDHLCGALVQPRYTAAADDDDDDDDSEEAEDSDDGWAEAEEAAELEEAELEREEEALRLQAELERVEGFRDEMEELSEPSSEGEAAEQLDALEELDAEIAALEERLRGWGGGRQPAARSSLSERSEPEPEPEPMPEPEPASAEVAGTGDGGSSSSAALLAAAGLELSPGGSSYTIIGRQRRPQPASPEDAASPPPPKPSPRPPPAPPRSPASWKAPATSSPARTGAPEPPARVLPALPPAPADWLDSGSSSDDSVDSEDENEEDSLTDDLQEEQESEEEELEEFEVEEESSGISAADVELYLSLIAEADEEDLRAILQDEGLRPSVAEQEEGPEAAALLRSRLRLHFAQKFGVCSALEPRYPLQTLQTSVPPGVKAHEKERHLSEHAFEAVFGVGRTTFAAMPKWRQQRHKRDARLF